MYTFTIAANYYKFLVCRNYENLYELLFKKPLIKHNFYEHLGKITYNK